MFKCAKYVFFKMLYSSFKKAFVKSSEKLWMIIFVIPDYFIWTWSRQYILLSHGSEKLSRQPGDSKNCWKVLDPTNDCFFDFKSQNQLLLLNCRSLKRHEITIFFESSHLTDRGWSSSLLNRVQQNSRLDPDGPTVDWTSYIRSRTTLLLTSFVTTLSWLL